LLFIISQFLAFFSDSNIATLAAVKLIRWTALLALWQVFGLPWGLS
jgi:hypothetical protein